MAFGSRQIFPNDLKPRVAIGVDIPFNAPGVFRSNYQTKDAIKANLLNIFLTNRGERIANPGFGVGLRDFIFEQISNDTLSGIEDDISEKISTYFPSIRLNAVEILAVEDQNTIRVIIKYSIPQQGISDQIEINFG